MLLSLTSFSSEFLGMTTRKVSIAFIDIMLVFKGRVLALEIFATGQQSHQTFLVEGYRSS
jgi:hypothetical protein